VDGGHPGFTHVVRVVPEPEKAVGTFASWVAESVTGTSEVLNIGAGRNLSGGLRPLRRRGAHLVGIDPDDAIWSNRGLDERYQATVEEFADDHPAEFDVALSVFVLEHVAHPTSFTAACARVLRPGGLLFGLTVHKYQYFGLTTWATSRLGLTDRLLERLKGHEVMSGHDHHHFTTEYRMNSPGQISRHLRDAGFSSAEFRMFDKPELYSWYLPTRLKPFASAWSRVAYTVNSPWMMGHLTFRAEL